MSSLQDQHHSRLTILKENHETWARALHTAAQASAQKFRGPWLDAIRVLKEAAEWQEAGQTHRGAREAAPVFDLLDVALKLNEVWDPFMATFWAGHREALNELREVIAGMDGHEFDLQDWMGDVHPQARPRAPSEPIRARVWLDRDGITLETADSRSVKIRNEAGNIVVRAMDCLSPSSLDLVISNEGRIAVDDEEYRAGMKNDGPDIGGDF